MVFYGLFIGCRNGNSKETKGQSEDSIEVVDRGSPAIGNPADYMVAGKRGYEQYCLSCHQESGSGVSGLNPPLKNTEYVTGDKNRLLSIVMLGSNVGLKVNGATYANAMPAFDYLRDQEIADITSYIRNSFGNSAIPVTIEEVAAMRKVN